MSDTRRTFFLDLLSGYVYGCRLAFPFLVVPFGVVVSFIAPPWWIGPMVAAIGMAGTWVAWNINLRKWGR